MALKVASSKPSNPLQVVNKPAPRKQHPRLQAINTGNLQGGSHNNGANMQGGNVAAHRVQKQNVRVQRTSPASVVNNPDKTVMIPGRKYFEDGTSVKKRTGWDALQNPIMKPKMPPLLHRPKKYLKEL